MCDETTYPFPNLSGCTLTGRVMITHPCCMMTSSNGNMLSVTGHLCREFTGPGDFPTHRPVTRSFDGFFDLRLNKRLSRPDGDKPMAETMITQYCWHVYASHGQDKLITLIFGVGDGIFYTWLTSQILLCDGAIRLAFCYNASLPKLWML